MLGFTPELEVTEKLSPELPGTEVVSIAIFDLWSNGQYQAIAALGCVLVAILLVLVGIVWRLGGRVGLAAP